MVDIIESNSNVRQLDQTTTRQRQVDQNQLDKKTTRPDDNSTKRQFDQNQLDQKFILRLRFHMHYSWAPEWNISPQILAKFQELMLFKYLAQEDKYAP
jgi:hypothetical protein